MIDYEERTKKREEIAKEEGIVLAAKTLVESLKISKTDATYNELIDEVAILLRLEPVIIQRLQKLYKL